MQNTLKKLFTSDSFFTAVAILGFIGELFCGLASIFYFPLAFTCNIMNIIMAVCTLLLYLSYKKHSKNVMKALMGAILMAIISSAVYAVENPITNFDFVFALIMLAIALLLLFNHLYINSEHRSNSKRVSGNQILCILYALLMIVWDIGWISEGQFVIGITNIIGNTFIVASVVCVESRLDAYRLDREDAGWTEEKGYPEGYVHEFEKK